MQTFTNTDDFSTVENNKIIGHPEEMVSSKIVFYGENNIIFFDEGVKLYETSVRFLGDNSVVFISSSGSHKTKLKIDIYNSSAFYIGKNCNTTRPIHVILSEEKHIFIGNDCLFSLDIWFRNADPHLIYDANEHKRINPTKSIFLGDHVWLGQEVLVTKGTRIGSGTIIGAKSVTGGKLIPSNCSCAGVPCKVLKENIFWLKPSVHTYTEDKTKESQIYKKDTYVYRNKGNKISFSDIDKNLDLCKTSDEKLEYLKHNIFENTDKNRFYISVSDCKGSATTNSKSRVKGLFHKR